jgi:hypothetical protein
MTGKKQARRELYGTKEVATILGIPEWRVKNFSEGAAYRLPPALQVGSGHGSRKLYGWEDIFRLGIANQLVNFGFTPESVGAAVREIPESTLAPYTADLQVQAFLQGKASSEAQLRSKETPLLVRLGGRLGQGWRVKKASEVRGELGKTVKHGGSSRALFVLNIANVCDSIFSRLERYWAGDLEEGGKNPK